MVRCLTGAPSFSSVVVVVVVVLTCLTVSVVFRMHPYPHALVLTENKL